MNVNNGGQIGKGSARWAEEVIQVRVMHNCAGWLQSFYFGWERTCAESSQPPNAISVEGKGMAEIGVRSAMKPTCAALLVGRRSNHIVSYGFRVAEQPCLGDPWCPRGNEQGPGASHLRPPFQIPPTWPPGLRSPTGSLVRFPWFCESNATRPDSIQCRLRLGRRRRRLCRSSGLLE